MTRSWRIVCPNEVSHSNIRVRTIKEPKYYCQQCEEAYDYLIDQKTGKPVQP